MRWSIKWIPTEVAKIQVLEFFIWISNDINFVRVLQIIEFLWKKITSSRRSLKYLIFIRYHALAGRSAEWCEVYVKSNLSKPYWDKTIIETEQTNWKFEVLIV